MRALLSGLLQGFGFVLGERFAMYALAYYRDHRPGRVRLSGPWTELDRELFGQ